jgi:hypothetical protein
VLSNGDLLTEADTDLLLKYMRQDGMDGSGYLRSLDDLYFNAEVLIALKKTCKDWAVDQVSCPDLLLDPAKMAVDLDKMHAQTRVCVQQSTIKGAGLGLFLSTADGLRVQDLQKKFLCRYTGLVMTGAQKSELERILGYQFQCAASLTSNIFIVADFCGNLSRFLNQHPLDSAHCYMERYLLPAQHPALLVRFIDSSTFISARQPMELFLHYNVNVRSGRHKARGADPVEDTMNGPPEKKRKRQTTGEGMRNSKLKTAPSMGWPQRNREEKKRHATEVEERKTVQSIARPQSQKEKGKRQATEEGMRKLTTAQSIGRPQSQKEKRKSSRQTTELRETKTAQTIARPQSNQEKRKSSRQTTELEETKTAQTIARPQSNQEKGKRQATEVEEAKTAQIIARPQSNQEKMKGQAMEEVRHALISSLQHVTGDKRNMTQLTKGLATGRGCKNLVERMKAFYDAQAKQQVKRQKALTVNYKNIRSIENQLKNFGYSISASAVLTPSERKEFRRIIREYPDAACWRVQISSQLMKMPKSRSCSAMNDIKKLISANSVAMNALIAGLTATRSLLPGETRQALPPVTKENVLSHVNLGALLTVKTKLSEPPQIWHLDSWEPGLAVLFCLNEEDDVPIESTQFRAWSSSEARKYIGAYQKLYAEHPYLLKKMMSSEELTREEIQLAKREPFCCLFESQPLAGAPFASIKMPGGGHVIMFFTFCPHRGPGSWTEHLKKGAVLPEERDIFFLSFGWRPHGGGDAVPRGDWDYQVFQTMCMESLYWPICIFPPEGLVAARLAERLYERPIEGQFLISKKLFDPSRHFGEYLIAVMQLELLHKRHTFEEIFATAYKFYGCRREVPVVQNHTSLAKRTHCISFCKHYLTAVQGMRQTLISVLKFPYVVEQIGGDQVKRLVDMLSPFKEYFSPANSYNEPVHPVQFLRFLEYFEKTPWQSPVQVQCATDETALKFLFRENEVAPPVKLILRVLPWQVASAASLVIGPQRELSLPVMLTALERLGKQWVLLVKATSISSRCVDLSSEPTLVILTGGQFKPDVEVKGPRRPCGDYMHVTEGTTFQVWGDYFHALQGRTFQVWKRRANPAVDVLMSDGRAARKVASRQLQSTLSVNAQRNQTKVKKAESTVFKTFAGKSPAANHVQTSQVSVSAALAGFTFCIGMKTYCVVESLCSKRIGSSVWSSVLRAVNTANRENHVVLKVAMEFSTDTVGKAGLEPDKQLRSGRGHGDRLLEEYRILQEARSSGVHTPNPLAQVDLTMLNVRTSRDFRIRGFVMESFEGDVSGLRISSGQGLADASADAWLSGAMETLWEQLRALHQKGIYHRDIKASNILFAADKGKRRNPLKLTLSDFDHACHSKVNTTKCCSGTPGYRAIDFLVPGCALYYRENWPEDAAMRATYMRETDKWLLCVTLLDLFTSMKALTQRKPWTRGAWCTKCEPQHKKKWGPYTVTLGKKVEMPRDWSPSGKTGVDLIKSVLTVLKDHRPCRMPLCTTRLLAMQQGGETLMSESKASETTPLKSAKLLRGYFAEVPLETLFRRNTNTGWLARDLDKNGVHISLQTSTGQDLRSPVAARFLQKVPAVWKLSGAKLIYPLTLGPAEAPGPLPKHKALFCYHIHESGPTPVKVYRVSNARLLCEQLPEYLHRGTFIVWATQTLVHFVNSAEQSKCKGTFGYYNMSASKRRYKTGLGQSRFLHWSCDQCSNVIALSVLGCSRCNTLSQEEVGSSMQPTTRKSTTGIRRKNRVHHAGSKKSQAELENSARTSRRGRPKRRKSFFSRVTTEKSIAVYDF